MSLGAALFDRPIAAPQARHLLQFKAGKMNMKGKMVQPDSRKGFAYVYQSGDSKVHFCWFDRSTWLVENDYILAPKQAEFKRVSVCKSGRVYVLKIKEKRFFIWMQEPTDRNDSAICESVNRFIESPIPPPSNHMNDWLGGIRGLSGLSQNDLLALLSMGVGLGGGLSSESDSSSAQALTATTGERHLNSSRIESPSVQTAGATSVPSSAGRTSTSAPSAGTQPTGKFKLQDLHTILSSVQNSTQGAAKLTPIDLANGVNADSVRDLLTQKEVLDRLGSHLPARDPEDDVPTPAENVISTIQSPQFKSSLKSFSQSFVSGDLGPVVSQFNLGDAAVEAAREGDLEALAAAMQNKPKGQDDKPPASKDDVKDSSKPDDDAEKMDTS